MKIKDYKHIIIFVIGLALTLTAYFWFIQSPYFDVFKIWTARNFILYLFILVILKTVGLIWPPLPGGLLTAGSIPVLGWLPAYLSDLTGSIIGASAAYYIAQKWGYKFISKIFDEITIEKIRNIKIKKHRELEAIFFSRIFGGTIVEAICYAAGLLNINFINYLIGTIASHVALGLPFYFFTNNLFEGKNFIVSFLIAVAFIPWLLIAKKRYLEGLSPDSTSK